MSFGYKDNFQFPLNSDNWRAISAQWPDSPIIERPSPRPWRERLTSRTGYWVGAVAFFITMATSAVLTPLYVLYQRRDHFSSLMVTVIFAVYAAGVVGSLFLVGHVSDWLGRRRILATGLLLNVASALIFIFDPGLTGLLVARVISGLSIGMTTATASAYLAELHLKAHPGASSSRAQILAIGVNLGGIGFGPLVAGALAQFAPAPLVLPYVAMGFALAVLAALVLATPETVSPPIKRPRWHPQRVVVPVDTRRQFVAATLTGLFSFAVYGVFSSLVPRFIATTMGISSHVVAGAVAFTIFATGALAQMSLSRLKAMTLLRAGSPTLVLGLLLLASGMWTANLALFVAGTVVTGVGNGLVFRGAMATAGEAAPPESRAEAIAGFFLGAYVGLSVPIVILGVASNYVSARTLMLVFVLVVAAVTTAAVQSVVTMGTAKARSQGPGFTRPSALSPSLLASAEGAPGSK